MLILLSPLFSVTVLINGMNIIVVVEASAAAAAAAVCVFAFRVTRNRFIIHTIRM